MRRDRQNVEPMNGTVKGLVERYEGHTPGPWLDNLHAGEKRDGGRFYVHVLANAAGVVPIACVPTGVEGYGREEGRANARLIADAPKLLAQLVASREALERIAKGQRAGGAQHENCLCHVCAAAPGELRQIASAALTMGVGD